MWVQFLGPEDLFQESMATHFSTLAWKIPWTEKPGELHSPWGHKESDTTEVAQFACMHMCVHVCVYVCVCFQGTRSFLENDIQCWFAFH